VRPVRFLYLCIKFCVYLLIQFTIISSPKVANKKRCTFKNNRKSHIFFFYSAPCHISLSLHQSLYFSIFLLTEFTMFSSLKGTYQRNKCTFKNNIKSHITSFLQCALPDCFIFASKFVFYLLTQFPFFLLPKVHIQEIGALSKIS